MVIRRIKPEEWTEAMALAWKTFLRFEASDYEPEGVKAFYRFVTDSDLEKMFLLGEYIAYGAFDKDKIVGIAGLRSGNFLSILFVDEEYHHRGLATALVGELSEYVRQERGKSRMLVYAAPYAIGFYHRIGFIDIGEMRYECGMHYIPMELRL